MSDKKLQQQEKVNEFLKHHSIANEIILLLNGNTMKKNFSILRSVKSVLKQKSIICVTVEELEIEHNQYKTNLEDEFINLR